MQFKLSGLGIQSRNEVQFIREEEIICILADGSYSHVLLTNNRRITLSRKLGEVEQALDSNFLRIHHSHIVNLSHVDKYIKSPMGYVVLSNGEELSGLTPIV